MMIPYDSLDMDAARFWAKGSRACLQGDREAWTAARKEYENSCHDWTLRRWVIAHGLIANEALRQYIEHTGDSDPESVRRLAKMDVPPAGCGLTPTDLERAVLAVTDPEGLPIPLLLLTMEEDDVFGVGVVALGFTLRPVSARIRTESSCAAYEQLVEWVLRTARAQGVPAR